jgi:2-polyprenyl-3-methyl-5-hydroxy-6-metoxy-1,4-benzoquinol methylase
VLDYGAGLCKFLRVARERGFKVEGLNPCVYRAEWAARELGIHVAPVFGSDYETDRRYDLIVTQQTLEHLINPREDLHKMFSLLRPGGILYADVPNWNTIRPTTL